jgi:DNA-binding response OmpR family regulator
VLEVELSIMNNPTRYKILIAEDAPVQGKKLQYVLEKFGYDVVWALDGILALEELKKHNFSLIITDYQMPNLDGLELLKKVRNDPEVKNIPIILLTTIEDEMLFLESLEAGANEFLNKPFRPEELKLRVKNLVSLYHYQLLLDEDNRELNLKVHEQNVLIKQHFDDLTKAYDELKSMQEQLVANSKMASLGVFSAGMAHEINNPLAIIKMQNKKLKNCIERSQLEKDALESLTVNIDKNADRINKIIVHLKKFSQTENNNANDSSNDEAINLSQCLRDLKDFYGGLISTYEIELKTDYEENLFAKVPSTL